MAIGRKVKDIVKSFDLFSLKVGFRFDDQPQYETLTGGICSIITIIIFIAIFTGTTINTFNKVYINSKITLFEKIDPPHYEVGLDKFMFAVGVNGVNLNEGQRWFDIYMQFRSYDAESRNKTYLKMIPCERSQWEAVN